MSQFFTSGGQSTGVSASASVFPMNIQDLFIYLIFRIDWLDLLAVQRDFQESSPTPQFKSINSSVLSFLYSSTFTSYMTTGKTIALTRQAFFGQIMSLLFNTLSRLVIVFSSKEQASFNFMAAVTIFSDLRAPPNKVSHCFYCFPIYFP